MSRGSSGDARDRPATGPALEQPLLAVRDLVVDFDVPGGPARAVNGVSFDVERGESVGLVGESGCGKTMACLALLGLLPEPGRIGAGSSVRVDGQELVGAGAAAWRAVRGRRVGMVFQEPGTALNPVLRVGDQIAEVVRAHLGVPRREAAARAEALLEEVGLDDPRRAARSWPHQLSGGMKQRAVIAGALAAEPDLLLADEPTTALDVTVQARILDLLARLRERRGMALLLVSHDLAVVSEVCDRAMVMYAGEIVERGPLRPLLDTPLHPYTGALVDVAVRPVAAAAPDGPRRLRAIPGSVPPPFARPAGCVFADRCPSAFARCRTTHPPRLSPGPGPDGTAIEVPSSGNALREGRGEGARDARCWLVEEPDRRREGP